MGRDVTGLRLDKKSNVVNDTSRSSVGDSAQVVIKDSPGKPEKNQHTPEAQIPATDECPEKQDVPGGNHEPEEKIIQAEIQNSKDSKLISPVESALVPAVNGTVNGNALHTDHVNGIEKNNPALEVLPNSTDSHSPEPVKKSEQNYSSKNHYDEEDNWSMASSTATSIRTAKITVPVAPKFTCTERLQRRKEFYSKLEEKHKALEKEKLEYQARIKEEEQAAIKLLRKNMSYKANPVPSFYREGPPAKAELKKLPVTRAKSPVFNRRKSCGDEIVKSSPAEKVVCGRATRHSIGVTKDAKSKGQNGSSPTQNGSNKTRIQSLQIKEAIEISDGEEKGNADIAVES